MVVSKRKVWGWSRGRLKFISKIFYRTSPHRSSRYLYTLEKSRVASSGLIFSISSYTSSAFSPSGSGTFSILPLPVASPMSLRHRFNERQDQGQETTTYLKHQRSSKATLVFPLCRGASLAFWYLYRILDRIVDLACPALSRRTVDHAREDPGIQAKPLSEKHRFSDHHLLDTQNHVVADLCSKTRTGCSAMDHPLSHQFQEWDREGVGRLRTSNKETESSGLGASDTYLS